MIRWFFRFGRAFWRFLEFRSRLIETGAFSSVTSGFPDSKDLSPWEHPYLTSSNIARFRAYSEQVWQAAREADRASDSPLKVAFCVNMAQNMTKWGRLAREAGIEAVVFPHPEDVSAINAPEWEVYDGEIANIFDGKSFHRDRPHLDTGVPCRRPPYDPFLILHVRELFLQGHRQHFHRLQAEMPTMRMELLITHPELASYYQWARELLAFDASYATSIPLASYLSGKPYCTFSCGGDLMIDCGRSNGYGQLMSWTYNASRFLMLTNPQGLGHCRRLGFSNALYLPYVMDDHRYCPGVGRARQQWEQERGAGFYVLSTARIDQEVKGNGRSQLDILLRAVRDRPNLRFVFLSWGRDAQTFQTIVSSQGLAKHFLFLKPVGKQRLIDYYRSCDAVMDQFVYGYYGATGLEAASVGKPIVMRIRTEQYAPLYRGDPAPVINCASSEDLYQSLINLVDRPSWARECGQALRDWLVRNHGHEKMLPVLLALLRLTARKIPLPPDLVHPLLDPLDPEEQAYHASRLSYPTVETVPARVAA